MALNEELEANTDRKPLGLRYKQDYDLVYSQCAIICGIVIDVIDYISYKIYGEAIEF